jgi:hypothetical protein
MNAGNLHERSLGRRHAKRAGNSINPNVVLNVVRLSYASHCDSRYQQNN